MTLGVISLSLLLQVGAALVSLRLAWRTRRLAWLPLSLAVLLMAARRGLTLFRAALWSAPVDPAAEWIALVISVAMLAGIAGLARGAGAVVGAGGAGHGPGREAGGDLRVGNLRWAGLFLGVLTVFGSAAVGYLAYDESLGGRTSSHDHLSDFLPWVVAVLATAAVLVPLTMVLLHWRFGLATRDAESVRRELRETEERLQTVVGSAPVVLFALDARGCITLSQGKGLEKLGLAPNQVVGRSVFDLYRAYPQVLDDVRRALAGEQIRTTVEVGGVWFETHYAPLRKDDGAVSGVIGVATDITELKRAELLLARQALYDPLTGLPNRLLFLDRLGQAIRRSQRGKGRTFAVLFLDLDRFKVVNDSLGHLAGDELLVAIGRRLETCVKSADTVARLGGDEFTVLVEEVKDLPDATFVAERIHEELKRPFSLHGLEVFASASIGIALHKSDYERAEDVVRDADTAMYRAKAMGKGRHVAFDVAMHAQAVALLKLETDLRRAVERDEFRMCYQPIVEIRTGRLAGFEALLRWHHPTRGVLLPDEFMRVAEETGLILPIGRWVLGDACRQMARWRESRPAMPSVPVVVNVSARQWAQAGMADEVRHQLAGVGLGGCDLKLEITESLVVENADEVMATIDELRALGIHIYIDDFGTGYSAFSYLHRFPFDALKVDRSFVARIGHQGENAEIVGSIVALGHSLGKYVIAEGIETKPQLDEMRRLRCEFAQGNLFSEPLPAERAEAMLDGEVPW